jgi:hypothetical protein
VQRNRMVLWKAASSEICGVLSRLMSSKTEPLAYKGMFCRQESVSESVQSWRHYHCTILGQATIRLCAIQHKSQWNIQFCMILPFTYFKGRLLQLLRFKCRFCQIVFVIISTIFSFLSFPSSFMSFFLLFPSNAEPLSKLSHQTKRFELVQPGIIILYYLLLI